MRIGVLALQGGYREHIEVIESLGWAALEVRSAQGLEDLDGLILPGGESTTQQRLMASAGLGGPMDRWVAQGRPVLATCAGAIVAAARGWVQVDLERNGWGRQMASFDSDVVVAGISTRACARFIRAPRIRRVGGATETVAWLADGQESPEIVGVRQGRVWVVTGHPELRGEAMFHRRCMDPE